MIKYNLLTLIDFINKLPWFSSNCFIVINTKLMFGLSSAEVIKRKMATVTHGHHHIDYPLSDLPLETEANESIAFLHSYCPIIDK